MTGELQWTLRHVSAAANKCPNAVDVNNNFVIFACANRIFAWEYTPVKVPTSFCCLTVAAPGTYVVCVKWIKCLFNDIQQKNPAKDCLAVAGCSNNTSVVCSFDSPQNTLSVLHCIYGHELSVSYTSGLLWNDELIIGTSGADSLFKLWRGSIADTDLVQTDVVQLGRGFVLCFELFNIYKSLVLILGCDDKTLKIYLRQPGAQNFVLSRSLMGHSDWIRSVAVSADGGGCYWIASGSQDTFVRIWKIAPSESDILSSGELALDEKTLLIESKEGITMEYCIKLETVLSGHDSWVYSVTWHPQLKSHGTVQLLSASIDKTIILWESSPDDVWAEKGRFGTLGGNTLGFYGATFVLDGSVILGHSYQGGFHAWRLSQPSSWESIVAPSGHCGPAEGIAWSPCGNYLLSVGADQTTRLFAPSIHKDSEKVTYHELARPQVHGHDMSCVASVSQSSFVTGSEEKVLRAFGAPRSFLENYTNITTMPLEEVDSDVAPEGASVPSLGLSNKAVYAADLEKPSQDESSYPQHYYKPVKLTDPPTEDCLQQNTLWPELHKLYGHGFEVFAIASNHTGSVLASSCKASKAEHAKIKLWSTATWKQMCDLSGHSLTVTDLAFSPCDRFLLSTSRDRTWSLFQTTTPSDPFCMTRVAFSDKTNGLHTRIIWSCAWTLDSRYFLTGSRDKKLIVWQLEENALGCDGDQTCSTTVKSIDSFSAGDAVTAVDSAPVSLHEKYVAAIGLESGEINILSWSSENRFETLIILNNLSQAHSGMVKKVKFRPQQGRMEDTCDTVSNCLQLASCGLDHLVMIHELSCLCEMCKKNL